MHHAHHHHHLPRSLLLQHLRPVSNMDSGLYSTSDSEQEDSAKTTPAAGGKTKTTEGILFGACTFLQGGREIGTLKPTHFN